MASETAQILTNWGWIVDVDNEHETRAHEGPNTVIVDHDKQQVWVDDGDYQIRTDDDELPTPDEAYWYSQHAYDLEHPDEEPVAIR